MDWLGLGKRTQLPEHWTAALGALLAVLAVFLASGWALGEENLVVATSMGSSAVLLFSTPHSPLSQPWPLVGGHVLAATVGVACASFLGTGLLSAGLAVGIAVLVMQWTRSTHPPAGAHGAGCGNRWRCCDRSWLVVRAETRVVERHPIAGCWPGF
jgi:CBS-domain-containing membrane protein